MIRVGQIYKSVEVPDRTIRVVHGWPRPWAEGKVQIVTELGNGRSLRFRRISADQLHATGETKHGNPRRTGYVLVRDVQ